MSQTCKHGRRECLIRHLACFTRHFCWPVSVQSFPATTLGTGTNVSHHDSGDWGGAQLVMAPWGWSTNIPATVSALVTVALFQGVAIHTSTSPSTDLVSSECQIPSQTRIQ
jgi:hypothetical protein